MGTELILGWPLLRELVAHFFQIHLIMIPSKRSQKLQLLDASNVSMVILLVENKGNNKNAGGKGKSTNEKNIGKPPFGGWAYSRYRFSSEQCKHIPILPIYLGIVVDHDKDHY